MNWYAAIIMGLAGSLHCAGMCGPLALALPSGNSSALRFVIGRIFYNLGRVITYAAMGVVFGLIGKSLVLAGWQQGLSIAAGVVLLCYVLLPLLGMRTGGAGPMPRMIAPLKAALGRLLGARTPAALLAFGLLNGLLPCGLVYGALAGAAATGTPADGALFMVVFGAGTVPMMLALSLFGKLIHVGLRVRFQRAVPVMLTVMGLLFILRGMSLGIPYVSPDLSPTAKSTGCCCHEEE